jgi:signal transduction histidine kinase
LRAIEFQFTALSFIAPEKLRFRHRLENFDPDWVDAGGERRVRYGHLPYGEYRFRVAACLPDGAWIETAEAFAFLVPTPLWRTPAAIVFYVLSAAGGIAGLVRFVSHRRLRRRLERLEQLQALERERMRIAQDMHDEIGSKLTKISFLSERARVESANAGPVAQQIAAISNTSRELLQTLDEIVWAVNPHNDTLEHLAAYFSQYAAEYFHNTTVECDLRLPRKIPLHPLSAETRHNLFLSFEEALNNVLKHSGAKQVRVLMAVQPTAFEINIADNGRGFDTSARRAEPTQPNRGRGGNGLGNMRQRLAQVGGRCQIQSQPGQGTTVSLHIPLSEASST